jgi:AcrR family transcriptional regulator
VKSASAATTKQNGKRPYRMTARAEAAAATGERILEAATELFHERPYDEVTLEDVARRAGVSSQTVIRRYGSKEGLFTTGAFEWGVKRVMDQRNEAPIGDIRGAVENLVEHYEELGDAVLGWLRDEDRFPAVRQITDNGRRLHREWVERTFAPMLAGRRGKARERRLAELIAVTDVLFWKLLRRDLGLSRRDTAAAISEILKSLEGDK